MSKKSNGYTLDLANLTLTVTAAFYDKLNYPKSKEYKLVRQLLKDFPSLTVKTRTHSTPVVYHNKDGSKTKKNQFKNLTYERMESFISALTDSDKYLKEYNRIKAAADLVSNSTYAVTRKWFVQQFPNYKADPFSYIDNPPEIINFNVLAEARKAEKKDA